MNDNAAHKIFYAPVNHPRLGDDLAHPWNYSVPAYRVAPHVWNVGGNDDVCAYLFDTGDGLILIDTGYRASLYLLIDRIYSLGFRPQQIKKILLSHWHWDHVNGCAALQSLSGAEVWISEEDEVSHQRFKDDTSELPMADYTATHFYRDDQPILLGRFSIQTVLTPGHTPGATSFRWLDTDDSTGVSYHCAMHGGIGVALMSPEWLHRFGGQEKDALRFVEDCESKLADWEVDIPVPSHLNQGNVLPNIPADRQDYQVWIAPHAWKESVLSRAEAVKEMYPEIYGR